MFVETELGEFLELITYGFTNPMPDADEGPWKITAKDVINGRVNFDSARRTTLEAFQNDLTDKSRPNVGDVLLTKDGTLGRLAVVKEEGLCVNQSVAVLRPNRRITSTFLYYLLASPSSQNKLIADSDGSVLKHIYITRVPKMMVSVPTIKDQKAIAHILGTLDDKIELNQKMNQTLEEIAKAIFKSWFVDFDPVRAKAESRPTGLPPEISDLFPDELMDSEIGEIPKGWEVKTIEDVAKVTSGKRPPEKESVQSETCQYVVYGGAGPMAFCSEPLNFTKPAIITGRVGTLGKVFYLTDDCWVSDNSILICDAGVYSPLVFFVLQSVDLTALNVGSTQPLVTGKDIKNLNLVAPSDSLLQEYKGLFDLIKNRQSTANAEIEVLSELRDTLLPKLISGELRIPDAEKFLEEAGI